MLLVSAPLDCDPVSVSEPDQAPDAVQELALLELQVSVELPPLATLVGLAVSATVGAAALTMTVADWEADPPAPVQLRV